MQFFIDTANIDEIKIARESGMLDGITTNPSLIAREKKRTGKKFIQIIQDLVSECPDIPISVEVLSLKANEMIEEGRKLAEIGGMGNIVVKLPCTEQALKACHVLSKENIQTNLTLCFSPLQALLVAKSGATYVSPFVGRLDDISEEGMMLIANIKMIYSNYGLNTKILVASIRNPIHVLNAAKIGANVVTVPYSVIKQLMSHPLTEKGIEVFLTDARNANQDNEK